MENQLQIFNNEDGSSVRCFIDNMGTAWINAEDAARGLGFVQVKKDRVPTSGDNPYTAVRWERATVILKNSVILKKSTKMIIFLKICFIAFI